MEEEGKMIREEEYVDNGEQGNLGLSTDELADAERDDSIIELIVSVQQAGNERGKRIYFDSKSMEEIKAKCGDDFFLFNGRTMLAFVDPVGESPPEFAREKVRATWRERTTRSMRGFTQRVSTAPAPHRTAVSGYRRKSSFRRLVK
jgi:hypothetical protein